MTLFLMTCVLAAPADAPAPLPTVVAAPLLAVGGCGTGGCGTGGICPGTADPCPFEKKGLFAKLRNAFRPKGKCVECLPAPSAAKSNLFGRLKKPVNYCGANCGSGCGVGLSGCSTCDLPVIPGSPAIVAPAAPAVGPSPAVVPAPAPVPAAPAGEKPATGKVTVTIPSVPAAMPSAKPAF